MFESVDYTKLRVLYVSFTKQNGKQMSCMIKNQMIKKKESNDKVCNISLGLTLIKIIFS